MTRVKTFVAGGTLYPADLNDIQDYIDSAIDTAIGGVQRTWQDVKQWGLGGAIDVPANGFYVCPMFFAVKSGTTLKTLSALHRINSGTNVQWSLEYRTWGGSSSTLATGTSTTSNDETDFADQVMADRSWLRLIVVNLSAAPQNMTFGVRTELTV